MYFRPTYLNEHYNSHIRNKMDRFLKKQAYIDERDLKFIKDKDRETLNLESDTLKGHIEFFI